MNHMIKLNNFFYEYSPHIGLSVFVGMAIAHFGFGVQF